ncbi:NTP pyrophosphatase, house-cleaning of non-canonical NTPs [Paenibacillus sp. PDC88]|nr:NTP pyrophosphatase, house-cleaning of non-canonical NTPs [Paenibacillus sp. PDC88]
MVFQHLNGDRAWIGDRGYDKILKEMSAHIFDSIWGNNMNITEFQHWVKDYYQQRQWSDLNIFVRIGFLAEETGEVARAIRALEIGRDRPDEMEGSYEQNKKELTEELGDVLGNLIVIANKYDISLEDILEAHKEKLQARYASK